MNKLIGIIYLICTSLLINYGAVQAYELTTHGLISQRAFERSEGVRKYLEALSIKDTDIFDPSARTPRVLLGNFFDNTGTPKHWMMEGTVREDDFTTTIPTCPQPRNPPTSIDRSRHHFFDVQRGGGGLNTTALGVPVNGFPAPDWASGQQGRLDNQFTIPDARQYQLSSLTEPNQQDRERKTALLFRTLGQLSHLLQDMAQPQHTRNDAHAGCLFSIGGEHSWYEDYLEMRARNDRYRSRELFIPQPLSFDAILSQGYTAPNFTSYRDYWTRPDAAGLADFSSRNFFSAGTNLSLLSPVTGNCGGLTSPVCNPDSSAYTKTTASFSYRTITGQTISGDVVLYMSSALDFNTVQSLTVAVTSRSVWDQHLESRGLFPVFSLNTLNYDSMSSALLPRALGYSAGLLDHFFRGKLKGVLRRVNGPVANIGSFIPVYAFTPPYTTELKLTNESDEEMEGNFALYADRRDGSRSQLAYLGQQAIAAGATRTFSFSVPEGFGDLKQAVVVFQGRLGQEDGAVAGSLVGPEFIEEWNNQLTSNYPWGENRQTFFMPVPHPDDSKQTIKVENGRLVMDIVRENPTTGDRYNTVRIGPLFDPDGNLIWEPQDPLPIPITSRTLIRLKYDINNEQPPCNVGFTCRFQFIEFGFSGQRYIQFTAPGQGVNLHPEPNPRVLALLPINPGTPLTVNIHDVLTQYGISTDNLVLEKIFITQGLIAHPDLDPRRLHMEVDYIRVTEPDPEVDSNPGSGGVVADGSFPPVGSPPRVTLTSPDRGEVFEGETITLTADTVDDGQVVSVKFEINGVTQFVDTAPPFTTQYVVPGGVGALTITVTATDNVNNFTSATYQINVLQLPDIVITSPLAGATVLEGDVITLSADVAANFQAVSVEFSANGVSQFVDTSPPFATPYTVPFAINSVTLAAKATNGVGGTTTATRTISIQPDPPPTVAITSPAPGSTVVEGQTITLRAAAQDNTEVVSVQFSVNGSTLNAIPIPFTGVFTAPYTVPVGVSALNIHAGAMDTKGQIGVAAPVVVNVIPNGPPLVVITSPAAGTTALEGSLLTLTAEVISGIQVKQVVWNVNGIAQAPVFSPPYSTAVTVLAGVTSLTIQATATDSLGRTGAATRTIPVQLAPPTVAITSPAAGATVIEGSLITLAAQSSANVNRLVWSLNGIDRPPIFDPPYQTLAVAPLGVTSLTIQAVAVDNLGRTATATREITVQPDPSTTVVGRVVRNAEPFAGATVTVLGQFSALSQADGRFTIPGVPTIRGISAVGNALIEATTLRGASAVATPLSGGITDIGDIVLRVVALPLYPAPKFPVGKSPNAVAAADLNGDGKPDAVAVNALGNDISVLLGKGDATFRPEQRFAVGRFPQSIATGDFNRDGILDIVVANGGSDDVSVLLGNGDGTFQSERGFGAGDFPLAVAVADLNGDAVLDIVTANYNSTDVSVLLGNGDGTFRPQNRFAASQFLASLAVADLNRDGKPDIVAGSFYEVFVFRGNGDGTFQAGQTFAAGSEVLAVADFNSDGIPDLVTGNDGWQDVTVRLGNGNGTFTPQPTFITDGGLGSFALADLNGDLRPDLVASAYGDIVIFLAKGDGSFEPPQSFAGGGLSLAVADFNGDGHLDLLPTRSAYNEGAVQILFGNGDGTFVAPLRVRAGDDGTTRSVAAADLNGDGKSDLVTTNQYYDDISVLLGNGDGTFQPEQRNAAGDGPVSVTVADLNRDGIPDLVTANTNSHNITVLFGNGDGSLAPGEAYSVGDRPSSVAVVDLNRDGIPDIITANFDSDDISILFGNGDGSFQPELSLDAGDGTIAIKAADLNGDGNPDLIAANRNSEDITVYLGNGDGSFQTEQVFVAGGVPTALTVADLNGDGKPDIVTANLNSNDISVFLGNGDGTFQPQQGFAAGGYPRSVAVADLNADSIPDIVTANGSTSDVSVFLGNGDGTFQPQRRFAAEFAIFATVADLNNDGAPDLAVGIPGNLVILLHQ